MSIDKFYYRHIGPSRKESIKMLKTIGFSCMKDFIKKVIPSNIRIKKDPILPKAISEYELYHEMKKIGRKNKIYKSYIGLGYYNTILPYVIQKNILENPGWYTAYTPYQAEISQGRLEALINFQTIIIELTKMDISNASLLDEGNAAADAMYMLYKKEKNLYKCFFVSEEVFPQTIEVIKTRAYGLGIEIIIGNHKKFFYKKKKIFGILLQYPSSSGRIFSYEKITQYCNNKKIPVIVSTDLLSLTLLKPPGEWGVDIVIGTTQNLGLPMGYGGPHASFLATKNKYKRLIPGRIIGISIDKEGNKSFRMALQTREQHIRREKATSNICTSQVFLAILASMYVIYHGPKGLKKISKNIHKKTLELEKKLSKLGIVEQLNDYYFNTLRLNIKNISIKKLKFQAEKKNINFRYIQPNIVCITIDETTSFSDLEKIITVFKNTISSKKIIIKNIKNQIRIPSFLKRKSNFLNQEIFKKFHTETELMRYIKKLEKKDLTLNHSMIPLGSCTMKLNSASTLFSLNKSNWKDIHPFVPKNQSKGYKKMIKNLENYLSEITGLKATSLQPNSGSQGEYAGLIIIKSYYEFIKEKHRNIVFIPDSAHGTNPASAVMANMKVVIIKTTKKGEIDMNDFEKKIFIYKYRLAALMITYPSTYGIYESNIKNITRIVHENGGQVYMDGANMNAQIGFTNPKIIGADICHLNLHKTFAIPHGGGGPGVGPICVSKHLERFLPSHPRLLNDNYKKTFCSAPYGSALLLTISYSYIRMLGIKGLKKCTEHAILNANYLKKKLEKHYKILYKGKNNMVAHEMIIDCRKFKKINIEVVDIAKRLIDYGYHAPTVSFPIAGTFMIEPTESENKEELDRFISCLIQIRKEIEEIYKGKFSKNNNVLKNSPHTLSMVVNNLWNFPYSREKAVYPLPWVRERKFWPSSSRINEAYGDRNFKCFYN